MTTSLPKIISKKRDGHALLPHEVKFFVEALSSGEAHLSQIGALLMAIYLNSMNLEETQWLTQEMINSGTKLAWEGIVVDKHSTGGVGDKISIPLAPALAANGLKVPMISGRGLGWTGGTLDKLESIPGFRVNLTVTEMTKCLNECGFFICATTDDICPADKIMYKIRDITATVNNESLITGSILSKKIAEGAKFLILDLKVGKAASFKDVKSAESIAKQMIEISSKFDVKTKVVFSKMDFPIGFSIGNSLEIKESIECLAGKGSHDILQLVSVLGGELLSMCGKANSKEEGVQMIQKVIQNGEALKAFKKMLVLQGVDEKIANDLCNSNTSSLPQSQSVTSIKASKSGWITAIDALALGIASCELGAGRKKPDDIINYSVGIVLKKKPGDKVVKDDILMNIHHEASIPNNIINDIINSVLITSEQPILESVIIDVMS